MTFKWLSLNIFSIEIFYLNCFFFCQLILRKRKYVPIILIFLFVTSLVLLHALTGSRNAPVIACVLFSCIFLTTQNKYSISIKTILLFLFAVILSICNFFSTQVIRESLGDKDRLNLLKVTKLNKNQTTSNNTDISVLFYRLGYFDMACEIISNKKMYESIFNVKYYLKSILDNSNLLTPGFDFYDNTTVACSLRFIYDYNEKPSRSFSKDTYHSDQITFFAEAYALFGFGYGFIYIVIVSLLFSYLYCRSVNIRLQALLIYLFYVFLNNFGLDTVITYSAGLCVSYCFYNYLFLPENLLKA